MDKHYYFVAQLPTLYFDREPAMAVERFLAEGGKWLGERDYAVLSRVDLNETAPSHTVPEALRDYCAFEFDLRSELARWRSTRGTDQEYRPLGFPLSTVREGTPLDVEKRLLRMRWDYLEEREQEHHFDLGVLILYFLKLQILRRLSTFDKEEGLKTFQNLCEVEV